MGKIHNALEKYRKERFGTFGRLRNSDFEVLKRFDPATGKIDSKNPDIVKDKRSISRLITYGLIHANGTLTPAGRSRLEELTRKPDQQEAAAPLPGKQSPNDAPGKEKAAKSPAKLTAAEWALLINYDRKTGNLLRYDAAARGLEKRSREVLRDPAIIQRLIDHKMILPGGWLTPKAIAECRRLEEKSAAQHARRKEEPDSKKIETKKEKTQQPKAPISRENLDRIAAKALLHHDPETKKLDMTHPSIVNHPEAIVHLLKLRLIGDDGSLAPEALARCEALRKGKNKPVEVQSVLAEKKPLPAVDSQVIGAGQLKKKIAPDVAARKAPEKGGAAAEKIAHKEAAPVKSSEKAEDRPSQDGPSALPSGAPAIDTDRIDPSLISLLNPDSFEAEQFKILRTNLLFPASGQVPRSVMVTSAMSGEGKSFVAANLAVSVARHVNWNVLLIDCDLRRPSLHRRFGFDDVPGLSNYLTNGAALPALLLKTGVERLSILPGGRPPDNPSELLSSERMSSLIQEVTARYGDRLIIIDAPPPMMTAESGALARQVDGILVVVKHADTPQKEVIDLIEGLGKDRVLGAIVNNFEMQTSRYYRKYYGKSY